MLFFESGNKYKRVCIWKDEVPFNYSCQHTLHLCKEAGGIKWHSGIICMEAYLSPRHISNYAMVFMKYTDNQTDKADIIINYGRENVSFQSNVLPFNKVICAGLDKEFADAVYSFFSAYNARNLPCGTIEVLCGGYDEIGSSMVSFKKVMELMVFTFSNIDKTDSQELQCKLLGIM